MPAAADAGSLIRIGVDVGGTFTDLVGFDGRSWSIVKVPSTPPQFQDGVIEAVGRHMGHSPGRRGDPRKPGAPAPHSRGSAVRIVHGSTVATNALLQRAGEPVAFVTTEGFGDMLLIGRQDRPNLYDLRVRRPPPITPAENCFTVRERIDAHGQVIQPLEDREIDRLIDSLRARGLSHAAVCLLFSFVNPEHERQILRRLENAGITTSLSSEILPEFREYERASTTAINASLRPVVAAYLSALGKALESAGLGSVDGGSGFRVQGSESARPTPEPATPSPLLCIMHSAGGTLSVPEAAEQAARLVLSGPAGGVIGAAFVARQAGFSDIITYDMGGTSTDVATVLSGRPQWTTASSIDGLPIALPMFDIRTIGAGGGSIAYVDAGGALRVGPRSAGAEPGPACYGRGGAEPTVTDANLVLGRIVPDRFLGGAMKIEPQPAQRALADLGGRLGKSLTDTALGIVRIAEANMTQAIRAVTARRGHDPRQFTLVSFGGAGGLHACALAEALEIPRVLVPPYCGVLSALGMVVAPAVVDVSQTVVHLGAQLDDARVAAEFGRLNLLASQRLSPAETAALETFADVRFKGQSHEVKVQITAPQLEHIEQQFHQAYAALYGALPESGRAGSRGGESRIEVVTLRLRRVGHEPQVQLPAIKAEPGAPRQVELFTSSASPSRAAAMTRFQLLARGRCQGPILLLDAEATTFVPPGWTAEGRPDGAIVLNH